MAGSSGSVFKVLSKKADNKGGDQLCATEQEELKNSGKENSVSGAVESAGLSEIVETGGGNTSPEEGAHTGKRVKLRN